MIAIDLHSIKFRPAIVTIDLSGTSSTAWSVYRFPINHNSFERSENRSQSKSDTVLWSYRCFDVWDNTTSPRTDVRASEYSTERNDRVSAFLHRYLYIIMLVRYNNDNMMSDTRIFRYYYFSQRPSPWRVHNNITRSRT